MGVFPARVRPSSRRFGEPGPEPSPPAPFFPLRGFLLPAAGGTVELISMIAVIPVWIGLSIAIAVIASKKGRSGFGWFLFALFLSPLIAGLFLLIAGEGI